MCYALFLCFYNADKYIYAVYRDKDKAYDDGMWLKAKGECDFYYVEKETLI